MTAAIERTDVLVIGSGFGGAIPAYHLAAGGAKVTVLERGPELSAQDFAHDLRMGGYTRAVDLVQGDGVTVVAGNCVGGSSVVYFAASLRAPGFVFERRGGLGRRLWPAALTRDALDPWYDRVEEAIPVARQSWDDVPYPGGLFAAACDRAGRSCNPVPLAVDLATCTNCNWMLNGCRFDAKRSMLLNYLPAARAAGAEVRPLHEVQTIAPAVTPGYRFRVAYSVLDGTDYRVPAGAGIIEAKIVVAAAGAMATPVILQRSAALLGSMPRAVGRHFSGNGDRVSIADVDETKVRDLLGLERAPGVPYEGFPVGKPIGSMSYDRLDPEAPEFSRFSLQQIYFPGITNVLAQATDDPATSWFGTEKKALRARWRSWLSVLAMTEDDNEGVFGPPPPTGAAVRLASSLSLSTLKYRPNANTLRGWAEADEEARAVLEKDGLARVRPWSGFAGSVSAHPLASCRLGDDPATSALDDRNELRGHPGLFVTDASAVPTSLCVNPSLTVAALAERACPSIVERAAEAGVDVRYGAPSPDGGTAARDAALRTLQGSGR
ncbi:GMC family oxidoreductase N-terminal domain-containing protein [Streptomyces sp. MNU89]|uniref:GMC family oxidoreductase N-terminal domain-containing protein n=1 Tax=Streptomyces sp. MNU89 TaxID=2560025 RepID=UPI001E649685|nr:GMC family oxidoreductase [Streptomyces sp. MNU89]MCC9740964.1 GMC family oxidoreductase [Streptomyces sp. MNU89]